MTENIRALKDYQWNRGHHGARRALPEGIEAAYRKAEMPDVTRTAVRLETAMTNEIPFIAPGRSSPSPVRCPICPAFLMMRNGRGSLRSISSMSWGM